MLLSCLYLIFRAILFLIYICPCETFKACVFILLSPQLCYPPLSTPSGPPPHPQRLATVVQNRRVCHGEGEGLWSQETPDFNLSIMFNKRPLGSLSFPAGEMGMIISPPLSGSEGGEGKHLPACEALRAMLS